MSEFAKSLSLPTSFGAVKSSVMSHNTTMLALAITFAASLASTIISGYCANHIHKSSCSATDPEAKMAYKAGWVSAVLSSLLTLGSIGGMLFIIMRK